MANGGQEITLTVYALVPHVAYICKFFSGNTSIQAAFSVITYPSVNSVVCVSPIWGESRATETVNVSLFRVNDSCIKAIEDPESLETEMWQEHPDPCVLYQVPSVSTSALSLTFRPVWETVVPTRFNRAKDGETVSIKGWGFSSTIVYRFHFVWR